MASKNILIYGAIARPQAIIDSPVPKDWKTRIKVARDRLLWSVGSTSMLDFRNYEAPYPTNVGDVAIAEAVRNQLKTCLVDPKFISLNWGELANKKISDLADCKAVVVSGSGYFHISRDGTLNPRVSEDLNFLLNTDIPVILYGVGVNKAYSFSEMNNNDKVTKATEQLLQDFASRCSLINFRDLPSEQLFAAHTNSNAIVTCDPAVFLEANWNDMQKVDRPANRNGLHIGINFSFHGPLSTTILRKNVKEYIELLKIIQKETKCNYHYFVHNYSEIIIPYLLRDSGVNVEIEIGSPYKLSSRYKDMNLHIGGMLHSCILSVGSGTPCVLLAYDIKHRSFAELFDLTSHCHDATRIDRNSVIYSVRKLIDQEHYWREKIDARLSELWQSQFQFLQSCLTVINSEA